MAEEFCWAITLAAGLSFCRQSNSNKEFEVQLDSLVYRYKILVDRMGAQIQLAQNLFKYFEST